MYSRIKFLFQSLSIRKKMLIIILPTVLLPLILVNLLTYYMFNSYIESIIMERLEYSTMKISNNYKELVNDFDRNTRLILLNQAVQRSLQEKKLSYETKTEIEGYMRMFVTNQILTLLYLDNKGNIMHAQRSDSTTLKSILKSNIYHSLEGTYGKMFFYFGKDTVFQEPGLFLYAARVVRHLDLNVTPGIIIMKIDMTVLDDIFEESIIIPGSHYMILDQYDNIVYHNYNMSLIGQHVNVLLANLNIDISEAKGNGVIALDSNRYIFTISTDEDTQWRIASIISRKEVFSYYHQYQLIIYGIFLLVTILSITMVFYLSHRFIKPIQELTQAMINFNANRFDTKLDIVGNDEISEAARSFNYMVKEMEKLISNIEREQRKLKESELQSLIYQINPHFIYNTLDNISMLSRMSGDRQGSVLMQLLSRMLRISLSKGNMFIKVIDEFEHVECFMQIQKIRYDGLFDYNLELGSEIENLYINKCIIQPVVENSIYHGFSDRYDGGVVNIKGWQEGEWVIISVEDNGIGIKTTTLNFLNSLSSMSINEIEDSHSDDSGGYGMVNIALRLKISYGEDFRIKYLSNNNGTKFLLSINTKHMNKIL